MSDDTASGWRIVSLGVAANNKEIGSRKLNVVPIEQTPYLDGELASLPFESEVGGTDSQGNAFQVKVTTDQAVEAEWLPKGSNRRTPEDIRRGQRVLLWKYADKNDYYWQYLGLDDHLFKLETVVLQISATADESADSTKVENSYYLEISSHEQRITLQTSQANGEFCTYAFQFNMKEGKVVLTDELGNSFMLDSKNTVLELENAEGTVLRLDKKVIDAIAKDAINMEATNSMSLKTKRFALQADTVTVKSTTNTFQTPNTTFTGNVAINGSFNGQGAATFDAAATFKGAVTFQQPITANGINSSAPVRGPNGSI
jgi:phage gp45-like